MKSYYRFILPALVLFYLFLITRTYDLGIDFVHWQNASRRVVTTLLLLLATTGYIIGLQYDKE